MSRLLLILCFYGFSRVFSLLPQIYRPASFGTLFSTSLLLGILGFCLPASAEPVSISLTPPEIPYEQRDSDVGSLDEENVTQEKRNEDSANPSSLPPLSGATHALALMGKPKYPMDFPHFDYVNPNAPKGGQIRMFTTAKFNNFNPVSSKGIQAPQLDLLFDRLTRNSLDEPASTYAALAQEIVYSEEEPFVTYKLNPEAKWHDGHPVTAEDVVFSFQSFKNLNPFYYAYYRDIVRAEALDTHTVRFHFYNTGNKELPFIIGGLQILPKHWWEGKDPQGNLRDITKGTLEPILGSGPYRIKESIPGQYIVYERVPEYWGKDLPVMRGTHNFDRIRFDVYFNTQIAFEAFKTDLLDWFVENQAKNWATEYDFPAVQSGHIELEVFPRRGDTIMQGYLFNLRRHKFQDLRVRQAFNLAFNFEAINRTLFHDQYTRIGSYFPGTELASSGIPEGDELSLLKPFADLLPPEIFSLPYQNPVGGTREAVRANLRKAASLLREAGWVVRAGKRVHKVTGLPMVVEFLHHSPALGRLTMTYKSWLDELGITTKIRIVDSNQYVDRLQNFDFDIVAVAWTQSISPGNELRSLFGSQAAEQEGSSNTGGISDPVVDHLIETITLAKSREELITATRALDRVLLWNHYVVPHYTYPGTRTARWDRFSYPANLPAYSFGFPEIWWWDQEKDSLLAKEKQGRDD